jgi:hypothetical protein
MPPAEREAALFYFYRKNIPIFTLVEIKIRNSVTLIQVKFSHQMSSHQVKFSCQLNYSFHDFLDFYITDKGL